eukprot:gene6316-7039_t
MNSNIATTYPVMVPLNSLTEKVSYACVGGLQMLLAVASNVIVVYVVATKRCLHQPTTVVFGLLALCDAFTAVTGQMSMLTALVFSEPSLMTDDAAGLLHLCCYSTVLLILAQICRDCYLCIVYPLHKYKNYTSMSKISIKMLLYVTIGITLSAMHMSKNFLVKAAAYLLFAVLFTFCFSYILYRSRQIVGAVRNRGSLVPKTRYVSPAMVRAEHIKAVRDRMTEKKVSRSMAITLVVFFISWAPIAIIISITAIHMVLMKQLPFSLRASINWATQLTHISTVLNPFLYAYQMDRIGREMRQFVRRIRKSLVSCTASATVHTDFR